MGREANAKAKKREARANAEKQEARANAEKKGFINENKESEIKSTEMEKLYTVYEAAEVLRVNHKTVRAWMKQGKLNYVTLKPGLKDKYRIKQSDLNEIIEYNPAAIN